MLDQQILHIREQIDQLSEYLNSDICKSCGEVALKLEQCVKELQEILNKTRP